MSLGQSFRAALRVASKGGEEMSTTGGDMNRRIRIIKRDSPPEAVTPLAENPTDAERGDAAATVMRWVGEMRERKGVETKAGFDNLFRKAASRASSERAARAVNISLKGAENNNESNQIP